MGNLPKIVVVHLYPVEMNIYGDRGNVLTLEKRLLWRGIECDVVGVGIASKFDLRRADIIFAGGGQDRGQVAVGKDLQKRRPQLTEAAESGAVMLTVCGTYQLFGRGFKTKEGEDLEGIGLFKARTVGSDHRMIGNIVVESQWGQLVGFENHSGETFLDDGVTALGRVTKGFGNNYSSKQEGAVYKNVYGTYLHGPILPKNPSFTDHLLLAALERRGTHELSPLDDSLENQAAYVAGSRPR
jgi:lipid II isoglutaminyl synthase (glutamine-hydrolysing)